jgi:hypothetical protein
MSKKKIKLKQIAEHIMAGGMVSQNAFSNLDMGFNTRIKYEEEKPIKLSSLVENEEQEQIDEKKFFETLTKFGKLGNAIYNEHDLKSVAESMSYLAKTARQHALRETEDWFDQITVNRNMKELGTLSNQFHKIAGDAQGLQERMSALYEDMGHLLGRYYDLDEALDKVGKEDDDIDNDGDSDESDEYLRKRRQAIAKSMKK